MTIRSCAGCGIELEGRDTVALAVRFGVANFRRSSMRLEQVTERYVQVWHDETYCPQCAKVHVSTLVTKALDASILREFSGPSSKGKDSE